MRRRDKRFATQARHVVLPNPLHDKSKPASASSPHFTPDDFVHDADARTCACPAGKSLYRKGRANIRKDDIGEHFQGAKRDGVPCTLRAQCLRTPDTTDVRNVAFLRGRIERDGITPRETHTRRMKAQIDSTSRRAQYGRRFATVEPVFANLRRNTRLDRLTRRCRTKVDGQWTLFCLVHNIEKLAHSGYARKHQTRDARVRAQGAPRNTAHTDDRRFQSAPSIRPCNHDAKTTYPTASTLAALLRRPSIKCSQ